MSDRPPPVAHSAEPAEVRAQAETPYLDLRDAVLYGCFGVPHDWRLIEERREVAPDHVTFWVRRWFCTRCRLVEETSA